MEFPNHGWWPTDTGRDWPTSLTTKQLSEFFATIAPTPEDRAQIAERLGLEPWGYSSKSDLWDCIRAWIFRRELGQTANPLDLTSRDAVDVVVLALEHAQKVEAGTATDIDISTLVCHLITLNEDLPGLLGVPPSDFTETAR